MATVLQILQITKCFLHIIYSVFVKCLLHPLHYWTRSVLWCIPPSSERICLPNSCVPILLSFLNLCPLPLLLWYKKLQRHLINADDYKGVALWLMTFIEFTWNANIPRNTLWAHFTQGIAKFDTLLTYYELLVLWVLLNQCTLNITWPSICITV